MTLARRVAALEVSLSPTQLVLRWLAEAHTFGNLGAYVDAILGDDPEEFPLNRLCREAVAGARAATGKRAREQIDAAIGTALRQTVFRFELAMRITVTTHELIDREALVCAVLSGHLALLASARPQRPGSDPAHCEQLAQDLAHLVRRVADLHAVQAARELAETRYFDGQPVLFPDGIRAWHEQVHASERLAVMTDRLAELDGAARPELADTEAVEARVPAFLADLVEPAKVTALEKLGQGDRAFGIATTWLRSRRSADSWPPTPSTR